MKRIQNALIIAIVSCLILMAGQLQLPLAFAQEPFEEDEETMELNWENVPIQDIIKHFAETIQKNFLIPTPLTATITIISGGRIPESAAFDIIQTVLAEKNFMLVESEHLLKVVQMPTGIKPALTEFLDDPVADDLRLKDSVVTAIVVPKYTDSREMLSLLSKFKTSTGIIDIFPTSNALIIKDTEANIKYLLELMKRVDVSGTERKVTIHKLVYAMANDLARLLTDIISSKGVISAGPGGAAPTGPPAPGRSRGSSRAGSRSGQDGVKIIPYDRMNALIIVASEKETQEILDLIEKFDTPPDFEDYALHIYQAQNQEAGKLADTMLKFTQQIIKHEKAAAKGKGGVPSMGPGGGKTGEKEVFFTPDEATNKILIYAPPQDYEMYLGLLEELDRPQPQVLIEAWVVEISSSDQFNIGFEMQPFTPAPGQREGPAVDEIFAATSFSLGTSGFANQGSIPGSGASVLFRTLNNTKIKIGDTTFQVPDFDTFFQLLKAETDVDILATPKLLVLNNKSASVTVSDEISISTSNVSGTGDNRDVVETFNRQKVGITLDLEPQINADGYVLMKVTLDVQTIPGGAGAAGSQPVINIRNTQNEVRIENGKTIAISGLRRVDRARSVSKVPLLGDIPLIGELFKSRSTLKANVNLLIFITPHIVTETGEMLETTRMLREQDIEKKRNEIAPYTKQNRKKLEKALRKAKKESS
jgi:general secretion pathway protein D